MGGGTHLAWLTAHRRLARDYERRPATSEAMIRWAAIGLMTFQANRAGLLEGTHGDEAGRLPLHHRTRSTAF